MSAERFSLTEVVRILQDEDATYGSEPNDETGENPIQIDTISVGSIDAVSGEFTSLLRDDNDIFSESLLPETDLNNNCLGIFNDLECENDESFADKDISVSELSADENLEINTETNNSSNETIESLEGEGSETNRNHSVVARGRKRHRDESSWAKNVRKRRRQAGDEYMTTKGVVKRARGVKTTKDCAGKCKYKCSSFFSESRRKNIFDSFWKLNDTEKNSFYGNTTDCQLKERKRGNSDRKKKSVKYYLVIDLERIRVCKEFYLGTLDISNKRIDYFHRRGPEAKYIDKRGRCQKQKTPNEVLEGIREHINSYPRIESHYCRSSTTKEYLEAGLSVSKMYKHYTIECAKKEQIQAKIHTYRRVINNDFNIGFF